MTRQIWITLTTVAIMATHTPSSAQTTHQVPFGSGGNLIELVIENTGSSAFTGVTIGPTNLPSWISISPEKLTINGEILPGKPKTASFTFALDRMAPVASREPLEFTVAAGGGQHWSKTVTISVLPPERFELLQNYPNPFNPSTTIGFTLPRSSPTILKVYNLLGEEVAVLAERTFEPGYHQVRWDASGASSGVYLYRLSASGAVLNGRMMVLK